MDNNEKHPFEVEAEELDLFAEEVPDAQQTQQLRNDQTLSSILCGCDVSTFACYSY